MTLSDKINIVRLEHGTNLDFIETENVKEAIKELEEWILSNGHHDNNEDLTYVPQGELLTIMTGIFGRELCKKE
jgi:hypothetical protein